MFVRRERMRKVVLTLPITRILMILTILANFFGPPPPAPLLGMLMGQARLIFFR